MTALLVLTERTPVASRLQRVGLSVLSRRGAYDVDVRTLVWAGLDAPRMEIARVEVSGSDLGAEGTQIGVAYELRYLLENGALELEIVGGSSAHVEPGEADFVDLGFSPLTNTLPILRDGLQRGGAARDYVMALVDVPSLEVSRSEQRYEPIGPNVVRFRSGDFEAVLELDVDGFVVKYPGLAERRTASGSRF
jgi:hypothetical protein